MFTKKWGVKTKAQRKPNMSHKREKRTLEQMTHSELEHLLDREVSYYVRMTYANDDGQYVKCYTCDKIGLVKEMHAGHFISRVWRGTRWDLRNIRPQCPKCNTFEEGRHEVFKERLIEEIGEEAVKELERLRDFYGHTRLPRETLISEIQRYRKLNHKIKERLKRLMR